MYWQYWNRLREAFSGMDLREKTTFNLHIIYSILDGISLGIIALNEFVFLKNTGATTFHVGVLFQFVVLIMPFSIFFTHFLAMVKKKKRMLLYIALFTRAPLVLFLFFPENIYLLPHKEFYIWLYLLIFMLYYIASPIILPVINLFTKANYRVRRFGKLFSYSLTITQLTLLIATLLFGWLLDVDTNYYRFVFPVLGVLGFFAIYLITRIPYKEPKVLPAAQALTASLSLGAIYTRALNILKHNRAFADFQAGMMAYGLGFMMSLAVITVYLGEYFSLPYTEIAFYKNIPILISIISFPLFGRKMDLIDPRRFAIISFFFAMLFYLCLMAASHWPTEMQIQGHRIIWLLVAGYIFHGLFNASMGLIWGIGSSYFAPPEEAARYHAVHLSLTGLRGIVGPLLGVWIYQLSGFYGAFGASVIMQVFAMWIMKRSLEKRGKIKVNTAA